MKKYYFRQGTDCTIPAELDEMIERLPMDFWAIYDSEDNLYHFASTLGECIVWTSLVGGEVNLTKENRDYYESRIY
jgi:hypothetical protein